MAAATAGGGTSVGGSGAGPTTGGAAAGGGSSVEGACPVATVQSCEQIGDPTAQEVGCCQNDGTAVRCAGGELFTADCGAWETSCGWVEAWSANYCVPTGAGSCADVVAPDTTGDVIELDTIQINWDMACWDTDAEPNLFVFVEDYEVDDVALRFLLLPASGPAVGQTVDMNEYSSLTYPFFIETLSEIAFDEGGGYGGRYLAYAGDVTILEFNAQQPVGSTFRMQIDDLWARETTDGPGGCDDVTNGRRMHIESLMVEVTVGALHEDSECIQWAGG